jgi:hypothetical protein
MEIVAEIYCQRAKVADAIYCTGFHVEVRVEEEFRDASVDFSLSHSSNVELKGNWEEALDRYFNDGQFDCKGHLFPGEMRRVGAAREHKILFREAAFALQKDLEPHGYNVKLRYP